MFWLFAEERDESPSDTENNSVRIMDKVEIKKAKQKLVVNFATDLVNEVDKIPKITIQNAVSNIKATPTEEDDEKKKTETVNIDSLLNAYKQEAENVRDKVKYEDLLREEEEEENEDVAPLKVDQWGDMFKKERKGFEKVQSVTIKSKHQLAREDKTSKILLPVLKVIIVVWSQL